MFMSNFLSRGAVRDPAWTHLPPPTPLPALGCLHRADVGPGRGVPWTQDGRGEGCRGPPLSYW